MRSITAHRSLGLAALIMTLGLVAAACSNDDANAAGGGQGGDELTLSISSPADGASVTEPFTVKVDSDVPLGEPSTGDHHVHLCFDGQSCDSEYTLVYGNQFQVKDLPDGEHTIEASLRNADHSAAGPTASITVTVEGGGSSGTSGATGSSGGGDRYGGSGSGGYDYGSIGA